MTYVARTLIFETSVALYSITKGIYEICLLESKQWISKVLLKYKSLVIYLLTFIYFVTYETDTNAPSIVCGFHTK